MPEADTAATVVTAVLDNVVACSDNQVYSHCVAYGTFADEVVVADQGSLC